MNNFYSIFKDNAHQTRNKGCFLPKVEIKDYNVMIEGQKLFDQPGNNDLRSFKNIHKVATGQRDEKTIESNQFY